MSNNWSLTEVGEYDQNKTNPINEMARSIIKGVSDVASLAHTDVANFTPTAAVVLAAVYLNVTGALTAARNLVLPDNKHVYCVKNSTTGGFVLTVKTSAGTGIKVWPGEEVMVRSDGTNIVRAGAGAAPSIMVFGTSTLTVSVGASFWLWPGYEASSAQATELLVPVPVKGIVKDLFVRSVGAPVGGSLALMVRKKLAGGAVADTTLTLTHAIAATESSDQAHAFAVDRGDSIAIRVVENAGYTSGATAIVASLSIVQVE